MTADRKFKVYFSATACVLAGAIVWTASTLLHRDDVELTLSCSPQLAEDLHDVNAIAGAERITWNVLQRGETIHAWLSPDSDDNQLHLSFSYLGRRITWQSEQQPEKQSEQFKLSIDHHGAVHAQ